MATGQPKRSKIDYSPLAGFYRIQGTLGDGGFGKVKLGTHVLTGEEVAIKIMNKADLGSDLPRVKREIDALKRLNHVSICQLYEVIETKKAYYLILELCRGGELFDYIVTKERLSEDEARGVFRQLVAAVGYIHRSGFAHRDLKPENVLLCDGDSIRLIDFGLCAKPRHGVETDPLRTCCGSPAYAAPELLSGKPYFGNEVDIWSLGVMLYALLCGCLPFDTDSDDTAKLYRLIKSGEYEEPENLSDNARKLIKRMLQKMPMLRATVKEIASHPWVVGDENCPVDIDAGVRSSIIDSHCAAVMARYYQVSVDEMYNRLQSWSYDHLTATYLLLLRQANAAVDGRPPTLYTGARDYVESMMLTPAATTKRRFDYEVLHGGGEGRTALVDSGNFVAPVMGDKTDAVANRKRPHYEHNPAMALATPARANPNDHIVRNQYTTSRAKVARIIKLPEEKEPLTSKISFDDSSDIVPFPEDPSTDEGMTELTDVSAVVASDPSSPRSIPDYEQWSSTAPSTSSVADDVNTSSANSFERSMTHTVESFTKTASDAVADANKAVLTPKGTHALLSNKLLPVIKPDNKTDIPVEQSSLAETGDGTPKPEEPIPLPASSKRTNALDYETATASPGAHSRLSPSRSYGSLTKQHLLTQSVVAGANVNTAVSKGLGDDQRQMTLDHRALSLDTSLHIIEDDQENAQAIPKDPSPPAKAPRQQPVATEKLITEAMGSKFSAGRARAIRNSPAVESPARVRPASIVEQFVVKSSSKGSSKKPSYRGRSVVNFLRNLTTPRKARQRSEAGDVERPRTARGSLLAIIDSVPVGEVDRIKRALDEVLSHGGRFQAINVIKNTQFKLRCAIHNDWGVTKLCFDVEICMNSSGQCGLKTHRVTGDAMHYRMFAQDIVQSVLQQFA